MASQIWSRRERARDAGQASETRQMAEQDRIGASSSGALAIVLVLLGAIVVIALWLLTR